MTPSKDTPSGPLRLRPGERWLAGVFAAVSALATGYYLLVPRTVQGVAPQCAGGADCAVSVHAPVDGVIVVALIVLTALFTLMAVTGMVWAPSFGAGPGFALPTGKAAETAAIPAGLLTRTLTSARHGANRAAAPETEEQRLRTSLALWNTLPADRQEAATDYGREHWDTSREDLQLAIATVAHDARHPEDPFYARFRLATGEKVLRLPARPAQG